MQCSCTLESGSCSSCHLLLAWGTQHWDGSWFVDHHVVAGRFWSSCKPYTCRIGIGGSGRRIPSDPLKVCYIRCRMELHGTLELDLKPHLERGLVDISKCRRSLLSFQLAGRLHLWNSRCVGYRQLLAHHKAVGVSMAIHRRLTHPLATWPIIVLA